MKQKNERNIKNALREANFLHIEKVKWLGWVPETDKDGEPLRYHDGSLHGKYKCAWLIKDNKTEETVV